MWGLQTRAWIVFGLSSLVRVIVFFMGELDFEKRCEEIDKSQMSASEAAKVDCVNKYNPQLDEHKDAMLITVMAIRSLGLLFCVFCYKWRHLSNLIMYFDCIIRICGALIPMARQES